MQPVLGHGDWQVESIVLDRGTGLREWIEVRAGEHATYCATPRELQHMLQRNGLDLGTFAVLDSIDDGCE